MGTEKEKELEKEKGDLAGICAATIRKRIELEQRLSSLMEAIENVLLWRNMDGDGISDPLRAELYKMVKEGK